MLDTLPRAGGWLQSVTGAGAEAAPQPPDAAQVADAVARFVALREFRARLYACFTARADALFELADAILCADHAVTSLVQLSQEAEFTSGHGALYDALAAGEIDEEALAGLLTGTLPQLTDGEQARAWAGEHDVIDYGLLESAIAGLPDEEAAQVREACARWRRLRFAIDATPYPRPDAECSPEREHVHHDACRGDGTRKTIPGWEYQFVAAVGHLRTAWTAVVDVERTAKATRTSQTARQVRNLLRRLAAAGHGPGGAPLVILDAGYSAAALTAALAGQPVHLLVRLPAGSVMYGEPVTWPGRNGRPPRHGVPEHTFRFLKGALGLTAAKVRTPAQADRWARLVMAAYAQLLIARTDTADLRRPWEKPPDPDRPLTPGRVRRGFPNIRRQIGTPVHVAKPGRPGPGRPKGTTSGPAPRHPIPKKSCTTNKPDRATEKPQVKT
ncbi:MAG: hypothetical protein JWM19_3744 [Actinomycetia bacterium]|nr:hypothetical protein [Actinomycetes bacterium]